MKAKLILIVVLVLCVAATPLAAQSQGEQRNFVSVSSSAKVKAKPDICVAVLEVRSSAPLAADALQQNDKRVAEVTAKLKELGVKDPDIHWAGNQFTPSGGGRIYMPAGQRPTGFEVYNIVEIRMRNPDLSNLDALNKKIASVLDELGKLGAGIASPDVLRTSLGGSSAVLFAVEKPEAYEKQAYELAIEKARPLAEHIAQKMGVKITGIHSVSSSMAAQMRMPGGYEFEFAYFASSPEDLGIRATVMVNFAYK